MATITFQNSRSADEPVEIPLREDGERFPFLMYWAGMERVTLADTVGELLAALIEGYQDLATAQERLVARIQHALHVQVTVQAEINAETEPEVWNALSEVERSVLSGTREPGRQPHGWAADPDGEGDVWEASVPLVLVETGYAPHTDIPVPLSHEGDVADPSNLLWLRTIEEWDYLVSLHHCGYLVLQTAQT